MAKEVPTVGGREDIEEEEKRRDGNKWRFGESESESVAPRVLRVAITPTQKPEGLSLVLVLGCIYIRLFYSSAGVV